MPRRPKTPGRRGRRPSPSRRRGPSFPCRGRARRRIARRERGIEREQREDFAARVAGASERRAPGAVRRGEALRAHVERAARRRRRGERQVDGVDRGKRRGGALGGPFEGRFDARAQIRAAGARGPSGTGTTARAGPAESSREELSRKDTANSPDGTSVQRPRPVEIPLRTAAWGASSRNSTPPPVRSTMPSSPHNRGEITGSPPTAFRATRSASTRVPVASSPTRTKSARRATCVASPRRSRAARRTSSSDFRPPVASRMRTSASSAKSAPPQ